MKKKRRSGATDDEFARWAGDATRGMNTASMMLTIWSPPKDQNDPAARSATWYRFLVQVGYALTTGKPLVIIAPEGAELPAGLRRAADAVEFYPPPGDSESIQAAYLRALIAVGIVKAH